MVNSSERHSGIRHAADKAQDRMAGAAGYISAKMVTKADAFIENVAISNQYEIEAANMALERSASTEIELVAERMLQDHTFTAHELEDTLKTQGKLSQLPIDLDDRRKKMLDHLRAAPDDKFDAMYIDQQLLSHEEAVELMTGYSEKGDDEMLRSFAARTAPIIKQHLANVKKVRSEISH